MKKFTLAYEYDNSVWPEHVTLTDDDFAKSVRYVPEVVEPETPPFKPGDIVRVVSTYVFENWRGARGVVTQHDNEKTTVEFGKPLGGSLATARQFHATQDLVGD